jgi:hypothetical protein
LNCGKPVLVHKGSGRKFLTGERVLKRKKRRQGQKATVSIWTGTQAQGTGAMPTLANDASGVSCFWLALKES